MTGKRARPVRREAARKRTCHSRHLAARPTQPRLARTGSRPGPAPGPHLDLLVPLHDPGHARPRHPRRHRRARTQQPSTTGAQADRVDSRRDPASVQHASSSSTTRHDLAHRLRWSTTGAAAIKPEPATAITAFTTPPPPNHRASSSSARLITNYSWSTSSVSLLSYGVSSWEVGVGRSCRPHCRSGLCRGFAEEAAGRVDRG